MGLNIGSWNVRGLGTPAKRALVFDMLDTFKVGIACLQETHLTRDTKTQIRNKKYRCQFHAVHTSYFRGVSVLIGREVVFTCRQCNIDAGGRYIFLHCIIGNQEYTLANIYIPPPFKLEVLYCLLEFIVDKPNIPIIAVGDFNVVINKKKVAVFASKYLRKAGAVSGLFLTGQTHPLLSAEIVSMVVKDGAAPKYAP